MTSPKREKLLNTSAYDFWLPADLIAQRPLPERDKCNLLVLKYRQNEIAAAKFFQLKDYLNPGDCLVINNTKVLPARLFARKITGGKVEVLFLDFSPPDYSVLLSPGLAVGQKIIFPDETTAVVIENRENGEFVLHYPNAILPLLDKYGLMPLPPYIRRLADDSDRKFYQTVYARIPGSIAAPTAGLHFSQAMLEDFRRAGIKIAEILLQVGIGTFRPIKTPDIRQHKMFPEYYEISSAAAGLINETIKKKKRLIAVGTTVVRALEYSADNFGLVKPGSGQADIFIYPGYRFKVIKNILTNFHLPHSTPLLLVCALAGREKIFLAYQWAIRQRWRFFSYGDAMLILDG